MSFKTTYARPQRSSVQFRLYSYPRIEFLFSVAMLFSKITLLEINYKTVMKKNDEKSIFKNDSWRATQNQLFISIMCLHINISNRLFPIFVFQEYYIKSINLELR